MTPKNGSRKAVWAVSISVILIAVLLIGLFMLQIPPQGGQTIVLPPAASSDPPAEQTTEEAPESDFLEVTNDNVLAVLQTLSRPVSYRQTYSVTVGADDTQSVRQVELWVNRNLLQAEISDSKQTRVIISDGTTAYLWYKGSEKAVSVRLDESITEEDLLGLPAFDAFLMLEQDTVIDSDYLVLEDPLVQCIYVCTQDEDDMTRHWVNLENGLLYQSDVLENSNQVYTIRQTEFDLLATEDEIFADRFVLPDGSNPFTAAAKTQLP